MTDLTSNPMGLMGFEFVEFASPKAGVLEPLFEKMGFDRVGVRKDWFWENGHWLDELLYQKCLRK